MVLITWKQQSSELHFTKAKSLRSFVFYSPPKIKCVVVLRVQFCYSCRNSTVFPNSCNIAKMKPKAFDILKEL